MAARHHQVFGVRSASRPRLAFSAVAWASITVRPAGTGRHAANERELGAAREAAVATAIPTFGGAVADVAHRTNGLRGAPEDHDVPAGEILFLRRGFDRRTRRTVSGSRIGRLATDLLEQA